MSREKIIFLSSKDPFTTEGWSGIPYFMYSALHNHYDIVYVRSPDLPNLKLIGYYINRLLTLIGLGKVLFDCGLIATLISGIANTRAIKKHSGIKFIFSPSGQTDACFLKTNIPIIICSDCSMLQLIGYYPAVTKVMSFSVRMVRRLEGRTYRKARINVMSSTWAADFVRREFPIANVEVVPFGANLSKDHDYTDRDMSSGKCTLIFVGVDWNRKGGDIALRIREEVDKLGIDCRLIIVGSAPQLTPNEKIEIVRDLVKHEQEEVYAGLFRRADFMILPSMADCTPVVIAESFAFGVPVLASNTGGISQMIHNGQNGFLIENRLPSAFANVIAEVLPDQQRRKKMAKACRESYTQVFNWDKWVAGIMASIK